MAASDGVGLAASPALVVDAGELETLYLVVTRLMQRDVGLQDLGAY